MQFVAEDLNVKILDERVGRYPSSKIDKRNPTFYSHESILFSNRLVKMTPSLPRVLFF